jgi:FKBP-type peptidyl-prolyl cis-trans isomerase
MKIEKDRAVRFHYTVGEVGQPSTESSLGAEPLAILIGHNNIIPGLENAMEGHEAGDTFAVDVPAAQAYGERREGLIQRVAKKHFGDERLMPGMQVVLQTNAGPRAVTMSISTIRWPAKICISISRSSMCAKPRLKKSSTATSTAMVVITTERFAARCWLRSDNGWMPNGSRKRAICFLRIRQSFATVSVMGKICRNEGVQRYSNDSMHSNAASQHCRRRG